MTPRDGPAPPTDRPDDPIQAAPPTPPAPKNPPAGLGGAHRRLAQRFTDVDPETISNVLDEAYQSMLATSTITTYLAVLTERAAAIRLEALSSG